MIEGMPAKSSKAALTGMRKWRGKYSDIATALKTPKGAAIIIAISATVNVPYNMGRMPYWPAAGFQLWLKRAMPSWASMGRPLMISVKPIANMDNADITRLA